MAHRLVVIYTGYDGTLEPNWQDAIKARCCPWSQGKPPLRLKAVVESIRQHVDGHGNDIGKALSAKSTTPMEQMTIGDQEAYRKTMYENGYHVARCDVMSMVVSSRYKDLTFSVPGTLGVVRTVSERNRQRGGTLNDIGKLCDLASTVYGSKSEIVVVFDGHGFGTSGGEISTSEYRRSACIPKMCVADESDVNSGLDLLQIREFMGMFARKFGQPVAAIVFEPCLMGALEVIAGCHPFAAYALAAQSKVNGSLIDKTKLVSTLMTTDKGVTDVLGLCLGDAEVKNTTGIGLYNVAKVRSVADTFADIMNMVDATSAAKPMMEIINRSVHFTDNLKLRHRTDLYSLIDTMSKHRTTENIQFKRGNMSTMHDRLDALLKEMATMRLWHRNGEKLSVNIYTGAPTPGIRDSYPMIQLDKLWIYLAGVSLSSGGLERYLHWVEGRD